MIPFFKYQGTGNDFIMIDETDEKYGLSKEEIALLCDRRFGIGADGLILLQKDDSSDFRMIYHNADGAEGSLCGNGGRCAVKFAFDLGFIKNTTCFIAVDGLHQAVVLKNGDIKLQMASIKGIEQRNGQAFCDTGSPHVVTYVSDLDRFDVFKEGSAIRNNEYWLSHGGTNVNFVEVLDDNNIKVRTFERGVEAETYSCGTGVTAAALVCNTDNKANSPLSISTLGGLLKVHFIVEEKDSFSNIWLEGPAKKVFEGSF